MSEYERRGPVSALRPSGAATPPSTDDMRILDAKRHLGCVFHLRTPGVSTIIGFSKKIQLSLDGAPRLLSFVF